MRMINICMLAYVHVPKTGGFSIRLRVLPKNHRDEKSLIKYFGHVPISDDIKRKHTVVSCLRDPYDMFMSRYRYNLSGYVDDSHWKIQHMIDHTKQQGWLGYHNHWYKHNLPDIMLDFDHLQRDWNKLCDIHNMPDMRQLDHLHCTKHVDYIHPTDDQHAQIKQLVSQDTELYQQLKKHTI